MYWTFWLRKYHDICLHCCYFRRKSSGQKITFVYQLQYGDNVFSHPKMYNLRMRGKFWPITVSLCYSLWLFTDSNGACKTFPDGHVLYSLIFERILKMSNSELEGSDEEFGGDMCVSRRSAFMMLPFEERVFKMRSYLTDTTWPFNDMSKEDKRNFRRLSKQFKLDDDGYTLKKKIQLKWKTVNGKKYFCVAFPFFFFFFFYFTVMYMNTN